jgi:hypothetical protein
MMEQVQFFRYQCDGTPERLLELTGHRHNSLAGSVEEDKNLVEDGFEDVTDVDGVKLFRILKWTSLIALGVNSTARTSYSHTKPDRCGVPTNEEDIRKVR